MHKPHAVRKSLAFSFWEGVTGVYAATIVNDYLTPFALALKATSRQIGLLTAIPFLVSSFLQLKAPDMVEKWRSRRKFLCLFSLMHTFMVLPFVFIPYVFKGQPVMYVIVFYTLWMGSAAVFGPAYSSLLAEYVPARKRGAYFGWRNRIMMLVNITSSFVAGIILQRSHEHPFRAFAVIFSVSFIVRLMSWGFITQLYDPPMKYHSVHTFTLWEFLGNLRHSNFTRFVLLVAGMQFSVNLAAPFFSVYMLKDLQISYIMYTTIISTVTVTQLITLPRWGRVADIVGNVRIMKLAAFIIAAIPILWMFGRHPLYLILLQIISGIAWSGFNLSVGNFVFDAVSGPKRIRCIAYYGVINGVAIFLAALIGGNLLSVLPVMLGYKIMSLMLLSGVLRFIVAGCLYRMVKEVRTTERLNGKDLFFSFMRSI
jgi:MFS family permease